MSERIHPGFVKDHSTRPVRSSRPHVIGDTLLEAMLVAAVGGVFALATNHISPRGLELARNYFPTGTNDLVRAVATNAPPGNIADTNTGISISAEQLAARVKQQGFQWVDRQRALQLFHDSHSNQGVVFIDARDQSYYLEGHIPGAYDFNPYDPEKYFPVIMPVCQEAKRIVIYCEGGDCDDSETAALLLKDVGIPREKLFVYGGGITEWTNNRLPVETGKRTSGTPTNISP